MAAIIAIKPKNRRPESNKINDNRKKETERDDLIKYASVKP